MEDANEEKLLRAVTLQNARAVLHARERAEKELLKVKEELEQSNRQITELLAQAEKEIADRKQAEQALRESEERLRHTNTELTRRVAELQKANAEVQESPRAALNLMEDAVQSHRATERLNAELRESEERFRSLVSVITDVPWVRDATGAFVTPQTAWEAYTGQSWEEHRGFGWANALHPDDRERVKEIWQRACESRTLYQSEGRLWHAPTEQWRYFVAKAAPLLNPDGSVREWVGTHTDIDDQKGAEERLETMVAERTK